ncbi:MAG: UDP-N-acetylmuramoyl-tripeptide--D-alanyl-D-alanine ligase [Lachnospiraceae bacterium]|nr:UDP-N-acetylmuramoyl-tripeptide--D-alanyl-D-alanine ligase [Lachnospiraceae bacterium]
MRNITLRKIQKVTRGRLFNAESVMDIEITGIISDSRRAKDGCLFICIKGEKVDGHDFAEGVIDNGAIAVIAEKEMPGFTGPYLLVDSTFEATKVIAELYRSTLSTKFIGITGSVGKTSTKEFIATVLSRGYKVHKTKGNLNNEWGVPFTIFDIKEDTEIAVIEMGINHFGEMERLAKMVRPDAVVMTNIGQSHLEYLGSRDGILRAKAEIFTYLAQDGQVFLNGDDDKLNQISNVNGIKPKFYGLDGSCDVSAVNIVSKGLKGSSFDIILRDGDGRMSMRVNMPVPGRMMIYNALAAYLVGVNMGISPLQIKYALEDVSSLAGRNNIISTEKYIILDDCYNAAPASMKSSIDVLKETEGRKVAILGDMFELGDDTEQFHYDIGKYAADAGIDLIICVGDFSNKTYLGAKMNTDNQVEYYTSVEDCITYLPDLLSKDDNILVKASNRMHFSDIVSFLQS